MPRSNLIFFFLAWVAGSFVGLLLGEYLFRLIRG